MQRRIRERDPWRAHQERMIRHPAIYEWRHRQAVSEIMMMELHPMRDHIRRVLASEQSRAQEDARALIRSQQITGAQTQLNTSWPPVDNFRVYFGEPHREMYEEDDDFAQTSDTDSEPDWQRSPPPPYCAPAGPRDRGNPDRDEDGRGPRPTAPRLIAA